MKKFVFVYIILSLALASPFVFAEDIKNKVILLISEQNIEGPKAAWWASEIDLSTTEVTIAKKLIEQDYKVLEPSSLNKIIKQNRAFRIVNISENQSLKLANLSKADYVVIGKAIASKGGNVPQSNMRSCFANLTVKLIRVKDGEVIAYLDASGNCAHTDVITGGKEALISAAQDLAIKITEALKKEGSK